MSTAVTAADRAQGACTAARSTRSGWRVPGQAAVAGVVAVVSLLGKDLLGTDRLAGLGSAAFTTGRRRSSPIPLAAHMHRRGRRPGLVMALLLGALGSASPAPAGS